MDDTLERLRRSCLGLPEVSERVSHGHPARPHVGHRGWIGQVLEGDVDRGEVDANVRDAYRTVAPRALVAEMERAEAAS